MRRAANRYGLREAAEGEDWTLFWTDCSVSLDRVMDMKRYQVFAARSHSSLVLVSCSVSLAPPWLTRCLNFPLTENQPFSWHEWNLQEGLARAQYEPYAETLPKRVQHLPSHVVPPCRLTQFMFSHTVDAFNEHKMNVLIVLPFPPLSQRPSVIMTSKPTPELKSTKHISASQTQAAKVVVSVLPSPTKIFGRENTWFARCTYPR